MVEQSSIRDHRWTSYNKALKSFLRIVGNRYVTLDEFKELVQERVKSLDYLD